MAASSLSACGTQPHALPTVPLIHADTSTTLSAPLDPSRDVYARTHAGDFNPVVVPMPERVYVPNSASNTVDVIDPLTFHVVDHFDVGKQPQHVTPSWDLSTLYVDNTRGNTLTPIDPRTGKPGAPIPVDDPYNLYFTPDGSHAVVVAEERRRLDFRDPHTWQLVKSVAVPYAGIDHADFTADGRTMVISCEFSGWLVRVDVARMELIDALQLGGSPIDVKLSPDGTAFYVANQSRNGVSVVDAATFREVRFIPTGEGAHGLYPSRDGRELYVSNRKAGTISVLDFRAGDVVATWHIGGSPDMGGVSSDGTQLWLSGRYNRSVYVVDTSTGRLLHTIDVGDGPHGLSLFPQPGRFSLGHTGVYR
jgi:YVTN family beta-propeller protein